MSVIYKRKFLERSLESVIVTNSDSKESRWADAV